MPTGRTSLPDLILRGQTWYVRVAVPRRLWTAGPIKGGVKRQVIRSLETTDRAEAMRRRAAAKAAIQADIERLAGATPTRPAGELKPGAPILPPADLRSALDWRTAWADIDAGRTDGLLDGLPPGADPRSYARFVASSAIQERAEDVAGEYGTAAAEVYAGIAHGTATPLLLHVDAWLAEGGRRGPLSAKTAAGYRADLKAMETWFAGIGVTTIEGVTKSAAGRWISETMVANRVPWATANKRISAPASYWRWMEKRGHAGASPWSGQQLAKQARPKGVPGEKRPPSEAEVTLLLAGSADAELADAMRLGALSGMRLEELYSLTVADCADGWFRIRQAKTAAGIRRVPVHTALAGIVERRSRDKVPGAYLMHEARPPRGRARSVTISKRFGRYRKAVGVHEQGEGKRYSAVDFHSFRRRFVTVARNAGIDRAVVATVVGHAAQDITDGVYLGAFSDDLLRACVEAVGLPGDSSIK